MDGRHHRVNREIIFVPVPVAGSPAPLNQAKPPALSIHPAPSVAASAKTPVEGLRQQAPTGRDRPQRTGG